MGVAGMDPSELANDPDCWCNAHHWLGLGCRKPVLIMADVNISSQEFMTTTMSTVMQVSEVATGEATCNTGNELDSALVCTDLVWADLDRDHHHPQKELLQRFGLKPQLDQLKTSFLVPNSSSASE